MLRIDPGRARVEAALSRQMRALGLERPTIWRDGLGAVRSELMARGIQPFSSASLPSPPLGRRSFSIRTIFIIARRKVHPLAEARGASFEMLPEEACLAAAPEAAREEPSGALLEHALDPVYGAWCAPGEVNAGSPPGEEGPEWRTVLRNFWRPFLVMSAAGPERYRVTPEAVIALARPAQASEGGTLTLDRFDGERNILSLEADNPRA